MVPRPARRSPTSSWRRVAALSLAGACAVAAAQSLAGGAASAPALEVRAEVAPALQAAQQALAGQQPDEALKHLDRAAAVSGRTATETYLIERLRVVAHRALKDSGSQLRAIEAALATGQADRAMQQALTQEATVAAALELKDMPLTERWAARHFDAGGTSADVRLLLAQALFQQGRHAESLRALDALAEQQRAAGHPPRESQLRLQVGNHDKLGDGVGALRSLEQLVALNPKPELWAALLARVANRPGFDEHLRTDLLRLGVAAGAWREPGPWVELAERVLKDGFAAEAQSVVERGLREGVLGAAHSALRERAVRAAEADRQSIAAPPDARARGAMSAQALFNTGWNLSSAGQAGAGIALMAEAVDRGGLRRPDEARLRLGTALAMAGEAAQARARLEPLAGPSVDENVGLLARLWLMKLAR